MGNHMTTQDVLSSLDLNLIVSDRNVVAYLSQFPDEETQTEKAIEALKVGVIAIQSASPTLDTTVVQSQFTEMETRMRKSVSDFQRSVKKDLQKYFEDNEGVVPRSIEGVFGQEGSMTRTFDKFFDPNDGRLSRLMQVHIGPESSFGKTVDPQNKQGIITLIEARVRELVEAKLDEVLQQFSLDEDGSAMCRLQVMLSDFFGRLNASLGIKTATSEEAQRGHVKGMEFEKDLYDVFAEIGWSIGDETELVRGIVGSISRCKKGDYVATLGETSGGPGLKLVVEVKDQPLKLKDAMDELQEAKKNREAQCGIFVFSRGTEPAEVGDFRRIGEDFYVTVDKDDLKADKLPIFLDAAYRIARALIIVAVRKQAVEEVDLHKVEDQVNSLATCSDRLVEMATKARTIQNNGKFIEDCAAALKEDLDNRVEQVLDLLRRGAKS